MIGSRKVRSPSNASSDLPAKRSWKLRVSDAVAIAVLIVGISMLAFPLVAKASYALDHRTDGDGVEVMTISFEGTKTTVIDVRKSGNVPDRSLGIAGLWKGSPDLSDDEMSYVVGHNPGPFSFVADMVVGDVLQASDKDGNVLNMVASSVFDVPAGTTFDQIEGSLGEGERIVLQTCLVPDDRYRIVVCFPR